MKKTMNVQDIWNIRDARGLSTYEKAFLWLIASRGKATTSRKRLMEDLACSTGTVSNVVESLEAKNLIKVYPGFWKDGKKSPTAYTVKHDVLATFVPEKEEHPEAERVQEMNAPVHEMNTLFQEVNTPVQEMATKGTDKVTEKETSKETFKTTAPVVADATTDTVKEDLSPKEDTVSDGQTYSFGGEHSGPVDSSLNEDTPQSPLPETGDRPAVALDPTPTDPPTPSPFEQAIEEHRAKWMLVARQRNLTRADIRSRHDEETSIRERHGMNDGW